jgi:uncharacterized damage-inducible protein DinB
MYKLARPSVEQSLETQAGLRKVGLEVATKPGWNVRWDRSTLERYFAYNDWANDQILAAVEDAEPAVLDRDFAMGPGSIRKTLTHLLDVDRWWQRNWSNAAQPWQASEALDAAALSARWQPLRAERNAFVAGLDQTSADRILTVTPAGFSVQVRVVESLLQLCTHGTHHRAQLVNMLRQSGRPALALDLIDWLRRGGAGPQ